MQALGTSIASTVVGFGAKEVGGNLHLPFLVLASSVVVSAFWGRGPGILSALVGTAALDWFFLPPYHSLRLSIQDLLSLLVLLVIALFIGRLADRLRAEAARAREGERRAQATARLAKGLAGAVTHEQVVAHAVSEIGTVFGAEVSVVADPSAAAPAGWTAIPLRAPRKPRGTLLVERTDLDASELELAGTLASLAALAVERVHFVEVAREALVRIEGERMRNSILSTLSHDLRTPLTGILAGTEALDARLDGSGDSDLASRVREVALEARRMADLVENLLELSRLQSGGVTLRRDWNSQVELAASALRQRERLLQGREVEVSIADDAPLVWCDGILVERVLVNLLDNAGRHTPSGTPIRLWSEVGDDGVRMGVDDRGPGIQPGSGVAGRSGGIGLSLCRSIAEAHGGRLELSDGPSGGARATLFLPQDRRPPEPPSEEVA